MHSPKPLCGRRGRSWEVSKWDLHYYYLRSLPPLSDYRFTLLVDWIFNTDVQSDKLEDLIWSSYNNVTIISALSLLLAQRQLWPSSCRLWIIVYNIIMYFWQSYRNGGALDGPDSLQIEYDESKDHKYWIIGDGSNWREGCSPRMANRGSVSLFCSRAGEQRIRWWLASKQNEQVGWCN